MRDWSFPPAVEVEEAEPRIDWIDRPNSIVLNRVLDIKFTWIAVNFSLFLLQESLHLQIRKCEISICFIDICVTLFLAVEQKAFEALLSDHVEIIIDHVAEELGSWLGNHTPKLYSRKHVDISLIFFIVDDCFVASESIIIGVHNDLRLFCKAVICQSLLLHILYPG